MCSRFDNLSQHPSLTNPTTKDYFHMWIVFLCTLFYNKTLSISKFVEPLLGYKSHWLKTIITHTWCVSAWLDQWDQNFKLDVYDICFIMHSKCDCLFLFSLFSLFFFCCISFLIDFNCNKKLRHQFLLLIIWEGSKVYHEWWIPVKS